MIKTCKHHGQTEFAKRSKKYWRCKKCAVEAVQKRRRKVLNQLKIEAGGKCIRCSYDKNYGALQFHHRDPSTKLFGISRKGCTKGIDTLRTEAAKCDLICANCHAEEHHPHLNK